MTPGLPPGRPYGGMDRARHRMARRPLPDYRRRREEVYGVSPAEEKLFRMSGWPRAARKPTNEQGRPAWAPLHPISSSGSAHYRVKPKNRLASGTTRKRLVSSDV